jgi:hypothetical protein
MDPSGAAQLDMIAPPEKPEGERQGTAILAAPGDDTKRGGRPPGAQNKFNRDLTRLLVHTYGIHPLMKLAGYVFGDLEGIMADFAAPTREKAGLIKERLLLRLVDATTPKQAALSIDVTKQETLTVMLEKDLFQRVAGPQTTDGMIFDVEPNENKDLVA